MISHTEHHEKCRLRLIINVKCCIFFFFFSSTSSTTESEFSSATRRGNRNKISSIFTFTLWWSSSVASTNIHKMPENVFLNVFIPLCVQCTDIQCSSFFPFHFLEVKTTDENTIIIDWLSNLDVYESEADMCISINECLGSDIMFGEIFQQYAAWIAVEFRNKKNVYKSNGLLCSNWRWLRELSINLDLWWLMEKMYGYYHVDMWQTIEDYILLWRMFYRIEIIFFNNWKWFQADFGNQSVVLKF